MRAEIAEQAGELVEEAVDGVVDVVEVFRTNPAALVAAGLVGFGLGVAGGYFLARKLLEQQYSDISEEEIAEAKEFYAGFNKVDLDGNPLSPQEVMEALHGEGAVERAIEALREYAGDEPELKGEPHDEVVDEAMAEKLLSEAREARENAEHHVKTPYREAFQARTEVNVFSDDTFDLEEEQKFRTEDKPYIITHEEYFGAERDYEQWSYTYYEIDGVLTDEGDKPIDNADVVVGEQHLVRFGSGSKDPNIIYIRNDKLGADIEISRSKGSYLEEVLGIPKDESDEKSLKHSNRNAQLNRRRAFRNGDG